MIKRTVVLLVAVGLCLSIAQGDITPNGDVDPADPASWKTTTDAYIGKIGEGSVSVDSGSDLFSQFGYLGYETGSLGSVMIRGAGTTWTNFAWTSLLDPSYLYVGYEGDGALEITDGGSVTYTASYVGYEAGSHGAVTVSGAGSTWTNSWLIPSATTDLYVGYEGDGALEIADAGVVSNTSGYIGYESGSGGAVTVSGAGSTWTNSEGLCIGRYGNGTLTIADGGLVEVVGDTYTAKYADSAGVVNFDNGTLTTGGFLGVVSGTGTINTKGLVIDADLLFDTNHGLTQTATLDGPGRNIKVNLDVDGSRSMGVGYGGNGSMQILDGLTVPSTSGYLGYQFGSTGVVTVSGAESAWIHNDLYVGYGGDGRLEITSGAAVMSKRSYIGYETGSTGVVTVDQTGSTWYSSDSVHIGQYGDGVVSITDSGAVTNRKDSRIGHYSGSSGVVTVSGSGASWTGV